MAESKLKFSEEKIDELTEYKNLHVHVHVHLYTINHCLFKCLMNYLFLTTMNEYNTCVYIYR